MGSVPGMFGSESCLGAYVEALSRSLGHADRATPFRSCCTGLPLPGARKSMEPMAARVEPGRVRAAHRSLHHFVAKADWSDKALLAAVRARVLPVIEQQGPIRGWMIDDTGMLKKGTHSVGVTRQYRGQLGEQDNCQVAVTLSLAADHASLHHPSPVPAPAPGPALGRRPCSARPRRRAGRCRVPDQAADRAGANSRRRRGWRSTCTVLADAGYGIDTALRDGITSLGLTYVVAIQSHTSLWPPGTEPLPPKPWSSRGRPPSLVRPRRLSVPAGPVPAPVSGR